jgi:carbamoyl-phosphate synthase large subunit
MKEAVLVLGSGPIRIGQGIEFDYSCVHCAWAVEELGYRAVIVNNNPETVSTDFDTGDALYFEPVTLEDVLRVARREGVIGVVAQFGGQTAINLADGLHQAGVPILGTQPKAIAEAEDRNRFDRLLRRLGLPKPAGRAVTSLDEALEVARSVGFPVLVRPSFVLGGRAMEITYDEDHLRDYFVEAAAENPGMPVLVDQYLMGREAEVDVISDGQYALVPGIMEHIERAGVHSGDSMAVYPPVGLSQDLQRQMVVAACRLGRALKVKGLMNIQFVVDEASDPPIANVLEVNPRASRTVPFLSKVTGVPMVQVGTYCMMGRSLEECGYRGGLWKGPAPEVSPHDNIWPESVIESGAFELGPPRLFAVKAPVFSFQKLGKVEPSLGPEMKSTGEIVGVDRSYVCALYKALVASGITFQPNGYVALSVADPDKPEAVRIARELVRRGYPLAATSGTHQALEAAGIRSRELLKIQQGSPNLLDLILQGEVSLMINTPNPDGRRVNEDARRIRRACIESGVACVTSIDTAQALAQALEVFENPASSSCLPYVEYLTAP